MVARIFALLALAQCCLGVNHTLHAKAGCVDKVVQFRLMRDRKKCLDVRGGQVTDGAQLQIWDCNGHTNQNFMWCSDGRIVSAVNDNMCLDVPGGDPTKPNNLQLWQCNGRGAQYWEFDTNSLAIFSSTTGHKMCVDVSGGSDTDGAHVNLYYCSQGSGEKWFFGQGPPPMPQCSGGKGTVQYFQLNDDTTKCMDIPQGSARSSGVSVQISNCNGKETQQFIWCSDGRIVSRVDDNMCLDVPGGDPSKASNLQIWTCNRAAGQYWTYDGNAMAVYPWKTGETLCMDVSAGSTSPGTHVVTYPCNPGGMWQAQKWQINKAATEAYINV